ncbi:MAG TPA: hypothetical protein VNA89_16650 [Gemmatimonadaceae bacterium]|nr:hypothetical protein [Gemmatimonadaceae bacterium]
MRSPARTIRLVILLLTAAGCSASSGPGDDDTRPTEQLNFLRPRPNAPPLVTNTVSFLAVRGENSEVAIEYQPAPGEDSGEDFLRFRVRDRSLLARPDGTPFAEGESVQITITVIDPQRLIVQFEPSGLRFSPADPAELKFDFSNTDDDLDYDGDVDRVDDALEQRLSIWRQEATGQPWVRIGSLVAEGLEEVEGELVSFTNYVIAY